MPKWKRSKRLVHPWCGLCRRKISGNPPKLSPSSTRKIIRFKIFMNFSSESSQVTLTQVALDKYLYFLVNSDIGNPNAAEMLKDLASYGDYTAPGVEMHCLFGTNVADTVERYAKNQFDSSRRKINSFLLIFQFGLWIKVQSQSKICERRRRWHSEQALTDRMWTLAKHLSSRRSSNLSARIPRSRTLQYAQQLWTYQLHLVQAHQSCRLSAHLWKP